MNEQENAVLKHQTKKSSKSWLERLKDESWEAELLVSAIAIYGTFQLFGLINWGTNIFIDILNPNQYLIGYMIIFFGLVAVSILAAMFVIHFFLRAYWIGLVGLNSVFPDYSITDSAYSEIYTEKMLSILPKLKDSIQKVDELCSVIFSAAFTFLLMYSYIALFASAYLWLYNLLSKYIQSEILLIPLGLLLLSLLAQIIITIIANIKSNHKKRDLQIFSFKIVKLVSLLIYGPLYKSILQVSMIFGSNFKKKKSLAYLMLIFLFSGAFFAVFQINKTNIPYLINNTTYFDATKVYGAYYQTNNQNNDFLLAPEIESDKITSSLMKIFIPIFKYEKRMRTVVCGSSVKDNNLSKEEQRKEKNIYLLNCYKKYNIISLNGKEQIADYVRFVHPETNQSGHYGLC